MDYQAPLDYQTKRFGISTQFKYLNVFKPHVFGGIKDADPSFSITVYETELPPEIVAEMRTFNPNIPYDDVVKFFARSKTPPIIETFEGAEYRRLTELKLQNTGQGVSAYIAAQDSYELLTNIKNLAALRNTGLDRFFSGLEGHVEFDLYMSDATRIEKRLNLAMRRVTLNITQNLYERVLSA